MTVVKLKKLEKVYPNGFKAVHGIDLEIKDGEFMVFVGPSGCAKSTILRMIAGLEDVTGGEVMIGGKIVNQRSPKDRGIAMVFQNYALYPHMTGYENMAFALKMQKISKSEIDIRVKDAASKLEIIDLLERKPKEMSGGQKQRVAVGRAIVRKPEVFLFDEPLSNLDAKLRVSMRLKITQLHQELKDAGQPTTMIYVTHDQVEAMTMGDRICVLEYGMIKQVDTPINLYSKPKNKFVAGFIGSPSMNIIPSKLVLDGDKVAIQIEKTILHLPKGKAKKIRKYIGKKILFGIRPEHIGTCEIHSEKSKCIDGKISMIEKMGNEEFIYFMIDNREYTARLNSEKIREMGNGKNYKFWFDMEKCHIFDLETNENILL